MLEALGPVPSDWSLGDWLTMNQGPCGAEWGKISGSQVCSEREEGAGRRREEA